MKEKLCPQFSVPIEYLKIHSQYAYISEALESDMPEDWGCDWENIWRTSDLNCEAIIKLTFQNQILGLMRIALYPFPWNYKNPEYLEIRNLEAISSSNRPANPVGFWLIYYAAQIALYACIGDDEGSLLTLDGYDSLKSYYDEKVRMELLRTVTIAPREGGYAFRFTNQQAVAYSERLERRYGQPVRIQS